MFKNRPYIKRLDDVLRIINIVLTIKLLYNEKKNLKLVKDPITVFFFIVNIIFLFKIILDILMEAVQFILNIELLNYEYKMHDYDF